MGNRDVQLGRRQRARKSRVRVTVDDAPLRPLLQENALDCFQHSSGLPAMAARSHAQVALGPGHIQFFEENIGHILVIMLAGVNHELVERARFAEGA
jgi:hypothetical protein